MRHASGKKLLAPSVRPPAFHRRAVGVTVTLAAGLALAATIGCAPPASAPRPAQAAVSRRASGAVLTSQIVATDDDVGGTPQEVFARAKGHFDAQRWEQARRLFDRVVTAENAVTVDGTSSWTPLARAAAYNAALCSENLDDTRGARERFAMLQTRAGESPDALDAGLRRCRLDIELEDYQDLATGSSLLLARRDLLPSDRAEATAYQAMVALKNDDLASAERELRTALGVIEARADQGVPPQNAAAVHFARGELWRSRAQKLTFVPMPADFTATMEQRCQALLDAEDAYIEAIKTKDVRWAVRSGLRVSSLYRTLHDDLLQIAPPKSANTEARKALFRGAMRLRYRILLEKGLGTLSHTLDLEKTAGARGSWLEQARAAKADMERLLAEERAELAKLPYTEAELQKAFDDLATRAKTG